MFRIVEHVWRTVDGRMVAHGHPDAAFLAYAAGSDIPDDEARRVGLLSDPKARSKPADKMRRMRPLDKGTAETVETPEEIAP